MTRLVTVRFMGSLAKLAGQRELTVDVEESMTCLDLFSQLADQFGPRFSASQDAVIDSLLKIPFIVSFDIFHNEFIELANIVLPMCFWSWRIGIRKEVNAAFNAHFRLEGPYRLEFN